jgi:mono/diheme cytochrome c family protein
MALAIALPLGAILFVSSGVYDVGASARHTKFTEWLTHDTMIHSVRRHAADISPAAWTSAAQLVAGYCAYEAHCVACHGAAAVARQQWVSGMEPQPPYLLDATRDFTPSQLFWIASNGIKMTGMPAWRDSMSDRQIWNVVAWLEASRKLPPQTYVRWRAQGRCGPIGLPTPSPGPPPIPRPSPAQPRGVTGGSAPSWRAAVRP